MNPITIKNLSIGEGRPKVCVPIVGRTIEEITAAAKSIALLPADLVEWRADWFDAVTEEEKVLETAAALHQILPENPLLFTFRTAKEGGEKEISPKDYEHLTIFAAKSGFFDLIDVEMFIGDEVVKNIIDAAHESQVKVILSNHDFNSTPPEEVIVSRLKKMQDLGADIGKIALMPQSKRDVLTLLSATLTMKENYAKIPIVTMSMAGTGLISRLSGEAFGSAITFGAAGKTSAPGQIQAKDLVSVLEIIHKGTLK